MTIDELKTLIQQTPNFSKRIYGMTDVRQQIVDLTSFLPVDAKMAPRIHCIVNDIIQQPTCITCGTSTKYDVHAHGFQQYCSRTCSASSYKRKQKSKTTNLDRYGVEYPFQSEQIRQKNRDTCLQKYGFNNPSQNQQIRQKTKNTWLKNYGGHPLQHEQIRQKTKNTWLKNYGVENPQQNDQIRQKFKNTCLKRYNVENPFQSEKIRQKIKQTNLEKYHVEHPTQQHMIDVLPLITDYDWLYDQYINQNKTATSIAQELQISDVTVGKHLQQHEIAIKYSYRYSYICIRWLEQTAQQQNIYIQHALNEGEYIIPNTKYKADGFCEATNTIYEFHGDCWHGNPNKFDPNCVNLLLNKTMGELYQQTIQRENEIKSLGYNLVVMWESDFDKLNVNEGTTK